MVALSHTVSLFLTERKARRKKNTINPSGQRDQKAYGKMLDLIFFNPHNVNIYCYYNIIRTPLESRDRLPELYLEMRSLLPLLPQIGQRGIVRAFQVKHLNSISR